MTKESDREAEKETKESEGNPFDTFHAGDERVEPGKRKGSLNISNCVPCNGGEMVTSRGFSKDYRKGSASRKSIVYTGKNKKTKTLSLYMRQRSSVCTNI